MDNDKRSEGKQVKVPRFKKELGFETTSQRSSLMSKIRSTQTKPEKRLRKGLWANGVRYRINVKKFPGNPDIVIEKRKVVVFVDGEFWHGFNWEIKKTKIKTNRDFWIPKIERNIERDKKNVLLLTELGYRVFRFWEHEINKDLDGCIGKIMQALGDNS